MQQIQTGNHHHHQVVNHGSNNLSFFEQIKQSLGFGNSESHGYSHKPHANYGPPPQAPVNHFIPPKVHTKYGVPPKQHFISKPSTVYGMITHHKQFYFIKNEMIFFLFKRYRFFLQLFNKITLSNILISSLNLFQNE